MASIDLGGPLSAVSKSPDQSLCAIACRDHVKIVKIDSREGVKEVKQLRMNLRTAANLTITDVAWCPRPSAANVVAAAATNGAIAVWSVMGKGSKGSLQEKMFTEHSRSVHRIAWHHFEDHLLISGSQDCSIKLWDRRSRTNSCQATFLPRSEIVRDVQFSPTNEHIFACVTDSGHLQVWDRRNISNAFLKVTAHSANGFAVAWSPSREWVLATGSRDKTVKIWDLNDLVADASSTSSLANVLPRPQHTLFTPSGVGRIAWRPGRANTDQLATAAATGGSGDVLVWDVKHAHVPICVLRGHEDVCSGFVWMDTPEPHATIPPPDESSTSPFKSWVNQQASDDDPQRRWMGAFQHILSVGKDGKLIIHDLRDGYFPRRDFAPSALGVGCRGDVISFKNHIPMGDLLGLVRGIPSSRGFLGEVEALETKYASDREDMWGESRSNEPTGYAEAYATRAIASTNVPPTLATFKLAFHAAGMNGFDNPTVIAKLADLYVFDEGDFETMCEKNSASAQLAGLTHHSTMWRALAALVGSNGAEGIASILPFTAEVISDLLHERLEAGDCQHFVVLREVLQTWFAKTPDSALRASEIIAQSDRARESYLSYIDLLRWLGRDEVANHIIKRSDDPYLSQITRVQTTVHTCCTRCGKEIASDNPLAWCRKCSTASGACSICHQPVRELFVWCPVCGHGGHLEHLSDWFQISSACPTGCGHNCHLSEMVKRTTSL